MYTVIWCDHEGNQQQRPFDNLEDACTEYNDIKERYDGAGILDENGNFIMTSNDCPSGEGRNIYGKFGHDTGRD